MAKYLQVTGKILSRDNYREEIWNPEKNEYIENCMHAIRVEYTVGGKIYTHNFTGEDAHGEAGEDFVLFYREDAPENVKTTAEPETSRLLWGIPLIIAAVCILLWLFM